MTSKSQWIKQYTEDRMEEGQLHDLAYKEAVKMFDDIQRIVIDEHHKERASIMGKTRWAKVSKQERSNTMKKVAEAKKKKATAKKKTVDNSVA
jgi:hypothetical protein